MDTTNILRRNILIDAYYPMNALVPLTIKGVTHVAYSVTQPSSIVEAIHSFLRESDPAHRIEVMTMFIQSLSTTSTPPIVTKLVTTINSDMAHIDHLLSQCYSTLSDRARSLWGWRSYRYDSQLAQQLSLLKTLYRRFENRTDFLFRILSIHPQFLAQDVGHCQDLPERWNALEVGNIGDQNQSHDTYVSVHTDRK